MDYRESIKRNVEANKAVNNPQAYIAQYEKSYKRAMTGVVILFWIVIARAFYLSIKNYQLSVELKGVTAEQQMQAAQHADDRIWYHETCVPVSGKIVQCQMNGDLAQ